MNCRRKQIYILTVVLLVSLLAVPTWSQDRDAIIAKAKEEKEFVYYSTTDIRDGTAMVHAFQKNILLSNPSCFVSVARKWLSKFFRSIAVVLICST